MRYVETRLRKKHEEEAYRTYLTDALYCLTGMRGLPYTMDKRFVDIIRPDRNVIDEERSPEEIINTIKDKLERLGK